MVGDMDNCCEVYGNDEVSVLVCMINLLVDIM